MNAIRALVVDPALRQRRTASDYVADALRTAILDGKFADGEELNQVELANHFQVSRVPVREALRRLQAEGLVSAEAHRRAVVVGFSRKRLEEIFEIRGVLEGYTLEKATPHVDQRRLALLEELCDEMDRLRDHARWLEKNIEFHRLLLEPAGSRTVLDLVDQFARQVQRYVRRTGPLKRSQEAGAEHREILDAVREGDGPRARRLLERHIGRTLDRLVLQP